MRIPRSVVDFARQDNAEGRAVAGPGLILQLAAVLFNDAGRNGQAESGASFLCAKKGVEQAFFDFRWNAFSSVGHFQYCDVHLASAERCPSGAGAQSHSSLAVDGVVGVANQIDEDLFQMTAIGVDE